MDKERLKRRLLEVVDEVFAEFDQEATERGNSEAVAPLTVSIGVFGPVTYRWPDDTVTYRTCHRVTIKDESGSYPFIVAWQTRRAFGKSDRGRWAVFSAYYGASSLYPVIEFTETDGGRYAALIPKEGTHGRLSDSDAVPQWFDSATIERTDALFDSVQNGPSLRVVVSKEDFVDMALHGYWAGTVRHRLPRTIPVERPEVREKSAA